MQCVAYSIVKKETYENISHATEPDRHSWDQEITSPKDVKHAWKAEDKFLFPIQIFSVTSLYVAFVSLHQQVWFLSLLSKRVHWNNNETVVLQNEETLARFFQDRDTRNVDFEYQTLGLETNATNTLVLKIRHFGQSRHGKMSNDIVQCQ